MTNILQVSGVFLFFGCAAATQPYVISTYAGGAPPVANPVPGTGISIGAPFSVATDQKGDVYFASADLNAVFKLDPNGVLTRVAGTSQAGYSGDGGPATAASLSLVLTPASETSDGLAVDKSGNLFIADTSNNRVRRVSPDGTITTVAGTGVGGFSGDGGLAVAAQLNLPLGVAVNPAGDLFILDSFNNRIRKVSTNGLITTLAEVGGSALAVDDDGNVFVVALFNAITRISPSGTVTSGAAIGGLGVAVDSQGNLFITGTSSIVQRVSPDGTVTTVAGNGISGYSGDGGPATSAQIGFLSAISVDSDGNLLIADRINSRVRKVSTSGVVSTVAGNGTGTWFSDCSSPQFAALPADGGAAANALLSYPLGVAVDKDGDLFIADADDHRIRKVSPSGLVTTVVGTGGCGFSGDGGPAVGAQLNNPVAVAVDPNGNLWVEDFGNQRIRRVSASGVITTVAGDGTVGFAGDGGPASSARLSLSCDNTICGGVAVDSQGNVLIADTGNNRIRRISPDGIIATVAGNGSYGYSGDGGPATGAQLSNPRGVTVDSAGNLFISEDRRIRMVSPGGTITTVAGGIALASDLGYSGDGAPATGARLSWPVGVAMDSKGDLLIADPGADFDNNLAGEDLSIDQRIRKISPDGIIATAAGDGSSGFSGDGGPATTAAFNGAIGVAADGGGNVFVADAKNHVIRVLRPSNTPVLIGAVVDAASQRADAVSPGKIVVLYGGGMGPAQLIQNQASNGLYGTTLSGTTVSVSGIPAPILYTSATQVAAVVPYEVAGTQAHVTVSYQGLTSDVFTVNLVASAPSWFTLSQTGWGQASAINAVDGTVNTALNPVKIGDYISLWATGEGQTSPAGVDGEVPSSTLPHPVNSWSVTVGGIQAFVQYAGGSPGQVAGLMQVNVQIPDGVQPGGYVPVVLQVGNASTTAGAVWIAVAAK